MLTDTVTVDDIQIGISADDWEDAIRKSSQILLEKKSIEPRYVQAMIDTVKKNGPYMVISKHIALAHARPEEGANETALSFATLAAPINFNAGDLDPIKLIITFSAQSHDTHIDLMGELAEILIDEEKVNALINAGTKEEFYRTLKGE